MYIIYVDSSQLKYSKLAFNPRPDIIQYCINFLQSIYPQCTVYIFNIYTYSIIIINTIIGSPSLFVHTIQYYTEQPAARCENAGCWIRSYCKPQHSCIHRTPLSLKDASCRIRTRIDSAPINLTRSNSTAILHLLNFRLVKLVVGIVKLPFTHNSTA